MAPELIESDRIDASTADELYAFGVILWEMHQQQAPFLGMGPYEVMKFVLDGGRPDDDRFFGEKRLSPGRSGKNATRPKKEWPPALQSLVYACWQHDANLRPGFSNILDNVQQTPDLLSCRPKRPHYLQMKRTIFFGIASASPPSGEDAKKVDSAVMAKRRRQFRGPPAMDRSVSEMVFHSRKSRSASLHPAFFSSDMIRRASSLARVPPSIKTRQWANLDVEHIVPSECLSTSTVLSFRHNVKLCNVLAALTRRQFASGPVYGASGACLGCVSLADIVALIATIHPSGGIRSSDARIEDYREMIREVLRATNAVDVINHSRYNTFATVTGETSPKRSFGCFPEYRRGGTHFMPFR